MSITYNGKSVLAIYRNGTAVEQALIAWNWTPRQLYFGGVRGAAYVPDASTVYGAGAEAVFGAGISTILDEKNGLPVIGPELVVNGNFTTDISGWTIGAGSAIAVDGELAITSDGNVGRATQIVPVVVGKRYIVKATIRYGTSTGRFRVGTTDQGLQYNSYTDSFVSIFTAITSQMYLGPQNGATTGISYYSNISVREISENPATQTSTSLRPLLGQSPLVKRNILIQTEDFSSTAWSKSLVTFQSAANNRWKIIPNLVSATALNIGQIPGPSFPDIAQTFTGYFESAGARYVSVRVGTQSNRFSAFSLDLNTGIVTTGLSGAYNVSAESVATGSGWFVTFKYTISSGTNGNTIIICPSIAPITPALNPLCSGNGVDGVIVGQPQMELSSVATPYQRVGAAVDITESGVTSYPFIRMDLSDDTLVTSGMGSTKNFVRCSEEFENALWLKTGTAVLPSHAVAPDGSLTADLVYPTASGNRVIYQAMSLASNQYSISVYAKAAGKSFIFIDFTGAGTVGAYFNVVTGALGTVSAGYTANILSVGNGWYRCSIRNEANLALSFSAVYYVTDNDNSKAVTVNGTDGILLWGAQTEIGPTTTAYEYGGFKGTALVAGRNGTAVESVTLPDGNFTLGPTAVTSGAPGLLRAVGDIVGYNLINKSLTAKERKYLIQYYKDRGAKGMLISGPELVTLGQESGSNSSSTDYATLLRTISSVQINKPYKFIFRYRASGDPSQYRNAGFGTAINISQANTLNIVSYAPAADSWLTYTGVFVAPANTLQFAVRSYPITLNTTTVTVEYDGLSVKELRPEEEWV